MKESQIQRAISDYLPGKGILVFQIIFIIFLFLSQSTCSAKGYVLRVQAQGCAYPVLKHQRHDQATIRQLERAWTVAFLTGDTQLERCLLTADFTEIMSNGTINHLNDELELAEKNRGKVVMNPDIPPMTITMHGDVAVAYYMPSSENIGDGKLHKSYFADYFVWKDGGWHVYFAQQTSFAM